MKKSIYLIFVLAAALTFQSCLHDQEDVFDQSAADRLDNAAEGYKTLLESATDGWELKYYVGRSYAYGGYTYLLKFQNGKVTASTELASDPSETITSSYDVIKDQGPVLTFNTYNTYLHALSEPDGDNLEGLEADYEFVIEKASGDTVYLKGKKFGNYMQLVKASSGLDWTEYLTEISNMSTDILPTYLILDGGTEIGTATVDMNYRQFGPVIDDVDTSLAFCVTTDGIQLRESYEINGKSCRNFTFDSDAATLTCTDEGATSIVLTFNRPEGYLLYNEILGDYDLHVTFSSGADTIPITISEGDGRSTYVVSGLADAYDVTFQYNGTYGCAEWLLQNVGDLNGYGIWCCPFNGVSGYFTWASGSGLYLAQSLSDPNVLLPVDNQVTSIGVTGFFLCAFDGTPSGTSYDFTIIRGHTDWYFGGKNYYINSVDYLEKTN